MNPELQKLIFAWENAAAEFRRQVRPRMLAQTKAMYEIRAAQLEKCLKELREVVQPDAVPCVCDRRIVKTPAGTWKHVEQVPYAMANHKARPA